MRRTILLPALVLLASAFGAEALAKAPTVERRPSAITSAPPLVLEIIATGVVAHGEAPLLTEREGLPAVQIAGDKKGCDIYYLLVEARVDVVTVCRSKLPNAHAFHQDYAASLLSRIELPPPAAEPEPAEAPAP